MRLYLDDDTASALLTTRLRQAGHDVQVPADAGMVGKRDPVHLTHAVKNGRTFLTKNHRDFQELHDLVTAVRGHHPGILVIRQDNDRTRDLKPPDVVRAIRKLEASGHMIADDYIALNQWR